jgi:hypothetical protein
MAKNLTAVLILVLLLAGGIGYAIFSAPEMPEHRLFNLALKQFSKNAASLEKQFIKQGVISAETKTLSVDYVDLEKVKTSIAVKMSVAHNQVQLYFGEGNTAFANNTVILEPYFPRGDVNKKNIRWKCIAGSVLIRFRSKDCRLGQGIDTKEVLAK